MLSRTGCIPVLFSFNDMTKIEKTERCIDSIAEKTDSIIIMLSLGKDSLVTLDMCHGKFKRIVCVFMYFVKGLTHIERWISWCRTRYPGIEFLQVPHWSLTYAIRGGLYCVPDPKIKLLSLKDIVAALRHNTGIEYVFYGMKKADSMNRRLMLGTYEENLYENKGNVYPLAEWTQKDVLAYMKMRRMPTPVRYSKTASSGVGFSLDCFLWLRKHFPEDLEIIYSQFPMSRRILFEYDYHKSVEHGPQIPESDDATESAG